MSLVVTPFTGRLAADGSWDIEPCSPSHRIDAWPRVKRQHRTTWIRLRSMEHIHNLCSELRTLHQFHIAQIEETGELRAVYATTYEKTAVGTRSRKHVYALGVDDPPVELPSGDAILILDQYPGLVIEVEPRADEKIASLERRLAAAKKKHAAKKKSVSDGRVTKSRKR